MTKRPKAAPAALFTGTLIGEQATAALAAKLASGVAPPLVIALRGDLGAGKTAFARAFIRALPGAAKDEDVPSPTFTLVQTYPCDLGPVWHFDLYRIEHAAELRELGWDEAIDEGICLIEWPDKAGAGLPNDRLDIELTFAADEETRAVTITAHGRVGEQLKELQLG